ncbi:MAG: D-alanyl-D-alanine carboxypeptidase [Hungatella sp.]|nr:D-alanyl-D-alanine carboxypeptidase [Hungatella sp.]
MRRWRKAAGAVIAICLAVSVPVKAAPAGPGAGNEAPGAASAAKPEIRSEGAVVIDGLTGNILYGKNERERFYPASTTKLMTAMLVLERTNLNDTVTFSRSATTNLEAGAVSLNLTEGDRLTVEQCLYALLLKSANEVGNGLAEHVSGSVSGFAELMNQKAAGLGCTGTHFANPHGLNDSNHYTTPYDMALIGRAAFQNETLCKIATTTSYQFPATKNGEAKTITMGHKMIYPTDSRYYQGIIGGKTGYTSLAGNTLVTGAERNGVRLIAVVMKSKSTHYEDTRALLDYGFSLLGQNGRTDGTGSVNVQGPGAVTPPTEQGTADGLKGPGMAPAPAVKAGWVKDAEGWYYIKQDGSRAAGEWLNIDQVDYWIDSNGYMATGWRQFTNGAWYYFRSSGAMAVNYWTEDKGKWFYLGSQGAMLSSTKTPDGYTLGADGAWIP